MKYMLIYHSRNGWWEDVSEMYETKEEARKQAEIARTVNRIIDEYASIAIESEDSMEYEYIELTR